jgi:hypothetical protein
VFVPFNRRQNHPASPKSPTCPKNRASSALCFQQFLRPCSRNSFPVTLIAKPPGRRVFPSLAFSLFRYFVTSLRRPSPSAAVPCLLAWRSSRCEVGASRRSDVETSDCFTRHSSLATRHFPPITLLRPQPPAKSMRYPTNPDTPPGVGVPVPSAVSCSHYFAHNPFIFKRMRTKSITHRGWGSPNVQTLRPSNVPTVISSLESHPYAIARAKSHRMISLRKNQGVGVPRRR